MKIFITWSGELSHNIALLLRKWIPNVIQSAEPFISSEDFEKGAFWSGELIKKFTDCKFSLICVSKENIDSRWLNFEAGAMLKTLKEKKNLSPLLIGALCIAFWGF